MCSSVHFRGKSYSTPGELANLVGGIGNLIWQEKNPFQRWPKGEDWHRLDLCLCPINFHKTLASAGFSWRQGEDPMEYFIEDVRS